MLGMGTSQCVEQVGSTSGTGGVNSMNRKSVSLDNGSARPPSSPRRWFISVTVWHVAR
jgi:hypothetical protein